MPPIVTTRIPNSFQFRYGDESQNPLHLLAEREEHGRDGGHAEHRRDLHAGDGQPLHRVVRPEHVDRDHDLGHHEAQHVVLDPRRRTGVDVVNDFGPMWSIPHAKMMRGNAMYGPGPRSTDERHERQRHHEQYPRVARHEDRRQTDVVGRPRHVVPADHVRAGVVDVAPSPSGTGSPSGGQADGRHQHEDGRHDDGDRFENMIVLSGR